MRRWLEGARRPAVGGAEYLAAYVARLKAQNPYNVVVGGVLGGICIFSGYLWALLSRAEKAIPRELIEFHQKEQMNRLKTLFFGMLRRHP